MFPAYQIPLSKDELALLGELTVILGQVDEQMVMLVSNLFSIDVEAANAVLGSSKIGDNANIWANAIRNRSKDEDLLWLVEHAMKEIQAVSEGRNDFIHAVYEAVLMPGASASDGGFGFVQGGIRRVDVLARRVRKSVQRSITELQGVRDQAARLSCLVWHIGYVAQGFPADTSPWIERLAPTLPPRLGTVATRKAKAQPTRRAPSQPSQRQRRRDRRAAREPKD